MDDALLLSRLQIAWVIALHILLPAFTVGLASYIAVLEGTYFFTRRPVFLRLSKFWLPVFAVIVVVWNPVFPFPFAGPVWTAAQPAAAVVFLVAGALIKVRRP